MSRRRYGVFLSFREKQSYFYDNLIMHQRRFFGMELYPIYKGIIVLVPYISINEMQWINGAYMM